MLFIKSSFYFKDKRELCNLQLPELPSILGSRRGSVTLSPSPDANDRLDLLVKGEARKDTQGAPEGVEMPDDLPLEEVSAPGFLI